MAVRFHFVLKSIGPPKYFLFALSAADGPKVQFWHNSYMYVKFTL